MKLGAERPCAVNEGIEALFQRDEKSLQRFTFKVFSIHGTTFWTRQACRLKVDFRHEIFLKPAMSGSGLAILIL